MNELISIIVTCYNHEKYIRQCLESIYTQTYKNIELLIINDGSTDGSGEIIQRTLVDTPYENTEYLSHENQGICLTRNIGLEWAKGTFILFVDSDNYLDHDYVEKLVETAVEKEADIVYSNLFDAELQENVMEAKEFALDSYLKENYIDNCSLIRREKIGSIQYDPYLNRKKLVDYDFIMNIILNHQAVPVKCNKTKLNYRVLDDSISRKGEHNTERFYYEVYVYILSKHVLKYPKEVMQAIQENIFILTARLSDLIRHLEEVTVHVQNQENLIIQKIDETKNLLTNIQEKDKAIQLFKRELQKIVKLEIDNQFLTNRIATLESENYQLMTSTSFRLGNFIVKPANLAVRAIKNPKLVFKMGNKIKSIVIRKLKKIPTPSSLYWRLKRSVERKQNNYTNPKRMLIFVIYENQERLHPYKTYFLTALAKLVDHVLIVVNGNLNGDDIKELQKIGQVKLRENEGYDAAAFRYGIQFLGKEKLSEFDELLLVNDTNVGPFSDLSSVFSNMAKKKVDFWGITYGEEQNDLTQYNKYGFIPEHLQSYFMVFEKSMLVFDGFYDYWDHIQDTNSREKAIGKHETVFTKHFADLGFKHAAVTNQNTDSPMYIHPLKMLKKGVPLVKYTAFFNNTNDKFAWYGLTRETEVPQLLEYIRKETSYPIEIVNQIMFEVEHKQEPEHILIIDGVENIIPQLTKYRVNNKVEQLESLGYKVVQKNLSEFTMKDAEFASHIIIYRAPVHPILIHLIELAHRNGKIVLYEIDDLVIDTKYTDQLSYVKGLTATEKQNYDRSVINYGQMMKLCDGVVTSTEKLKEELFNYKDLVVLNRNLASKKLVEISEKAYETVKKSSEVVKIGYFSGSISHNENFEMIKESIIELMNNYKQVELHLVGHLDLPEDMKLLKDRIKTHPYVSWEELPYLVREVDINLAPLVQLIFNEAKSEIKWLEAALVRVPTLASKIGAFEEMVLNHETGILVNDDEWYEKLEEMVNSVELRNRIAENAYSYVIKNCTTNKKSDELVGLINEKYN